MALLGAVLLWGNAFAGNGGERGGGDNAPQVFRASAQEAVEKFTAWSKRHGLVITDPTLLRRAVDETLIEMSDEPVFLDSAHHYPREAVNIPKDRRIILYRSAWEKMEKNPVKRLSFPLHEMMAIARWLDLDPNTSGRAEYDDSGYLITAPFETYLMNELDLQRFKSELEGKLSTLSYVLKRQYQLDSMGAVNNLQLIMGTQEYRECIHPKIFGWAWTLKSRMLDSFASCLGVAAMIELVGRQYATRESYSSDQANRNRRIFSSYVDLIDSISNVGKKERKKLRDRLEKLVEQFNPIPIETLPLGSVNQAIDEFNSYVDSIVVPERKNLALASARMIVDHYGQVIRRSKMTSDDVDAKLNRECPGDLAAGVRCGIPKTIEMLIQGAPEQSRQLVEEIDQKTSEVFSLISKYQEE